MNENDEAITVVLGNQMREELWEGCHSEEESRLIKLATQNMKHHFFNDKLTSNEDFWIKFCSYAPDNTVFPYVYKFDDSAFLPYAFAIDYADHHNELYEEESPVYCHVNHQTIKPDVTKHSEIRKKAGIFYTSESDFPETFPDDNEPAIPKSSGFA